ncbi:hypothetical protein R1flu_025782 [Riccia fluitans]|uniref:Uncharacterized protein n=1 Tax=Riccia fluitans TaxID=41844 RepID=A0ABD1XYP9_9MARC
MLQGYRNYLSFLPYGHGSHAGNETGDDDEDFIFRLFITNKDDGRSRTSERALPRLLGGPRTFFINRESTYFDYRSGEAGRMPGVGFKLDQGSEANWDPMELARTRIEALGHVLGQYDLIEQLKEGENPAKELMENEAIVDAINSRIMDSSSGKAGDELCQWLYETYQTGDPNFQSVVVRYMPALCGVYVSRSCGNNEESLAGFEAVLLALYTEESKARGGRPLLIHLPNLSQPSLYHTPKPVGRNPGAAQVLQYAQQLCAPLEPQTAVKSTKRAGIVGLALELFCKKISVMPSKAKLEICQHARRWTLMGCPWASHVDEIAKLAVLPPEPVPLIVDGPEVGYSYASGEPLAVAQAVFEQPPHHRTIEEGKAVLNDKAANLERTSSGSVADGAFLSAPGSVSFNSATSSVEQVEEIGVKLALPLDLMRPILKALGHCLMSSLTTPEVQEAAAAAARALYVRASEDLIPEAIMAARSLVRLDAYAAAEARTVRSSSLSSLSTPPMPRNSDMFLVPS